MLLVISQFVELGLFEGESAEDVGLDRDVTVIPVGVNSPFVSDAPVDTLIVILFFGLLLAEELPWGLASCVVGIVLQHIQILFL